jgi:hypothetical protein
VSQVYTVRFWGGPRDGSEEQIDSYPPRTLHDYPLAYSKLGRYYQYVWTRAARERQRPERRPTADGT